MISLVLFCLQDSPVLDALRCLARHQSVDGSWGAVPEGCACPIEAGPSFGRWTTDEATHARCRCLIDRFQDCDIEAREEAQRGLERLGTWAIPSLLHGRDSGDPESRARCEEALSRLRRPAANVETTALNALTLAIYDRYANSLGAK